MMNHRTGNKIASVQFPLFFQIAVVENDTFNSIKLNNIFKLGVDSPAIETKARCLCPVPLQSVESELGRTGESEMAERETGESFRSASCFFLSLASLDLLARVTILSDC